jgi:hypothetical protein
MLGLALDPNFPTTPYVYLLYAYDGGPGQTAPVWNDGCPTPPGPTTDGCVVTGKLVRLQLSGNSVVGSTTLISGEWCQQFPSHSIGDLNFGLDGDLRERQLPRRRGVAAGDYPLQARRRR